MCSASNDQHVPGLIGGGETGAPHAALPPAWGVCVRKMHTHALSHFPEPYSPENPRKPSGLYMLLALGQPKAARFSRLPPGDPAPLKAALARRARRPGARGCDMVLFVFVHSSGFAAQGFIPSSCTIRSSEENYTYQKGTLPSSRFSRVRVSPPLPAADGAPQALVERLWEGRACVF